MDRSSILRASTKLFAAALLSLRGLFLTKTVMFWGNRLKIL